MNTPTARALALLAGLAALTTACTRDTTAPIADAPDVLVAEARSVDRCMNVDTELEAPLGVWLFNGDLVPGAAPSAVTLGHVDGWLGSILETPADPPQGGSETVHWELTHVFFTDAPTPVDLGGGFIVPMVQLPQQTDWFTTDDAAVCAAAGGGPFVCLINDRMPIVAGAGLFANAEGMLHNHGWITITDPQTGAGTGDFHARGRVCGDGV
jgi:hypothetical protein